MKTGFAFSAACLALSANVCLAQQVSLKCTVKYASGEQFESSIVIDPAANYMRVDGEALALVLTNEYYASTAKGAAGFVTVRRIDRNTGDITITDLYQGQKVNPRAGRCEKAQAPATKF